MNTLRKFGIINFVMVGWLLWSVAPTAAASVLQQVIDLSTWTGTPISPWSPPLPPAPNPGFSLTSLAYDPVLHRLYAADSQTAYVYMIDTLTNTVQAVSNTQGAASPPGRLDVYSPLTLLANPASGRWAVMGPYYGAKFIGTEILLLDSIPGGTMQSGASWNPATDTVYSGSVNFFATRNLKFLFGGFACSGTSNATTYNPGTNRVYVSCGFSDSSAGIYVFDGIDLLNGGKNYQPPPIGSAVIGRPSSGALGLAVNPNTNRVYASGLTSPTSLDVLDASTYQLLTSVPGIPNQSTSRQYSIGFGSTPLAQPIAINTLTNTIFVLNSLTSTISVFDGNTSSFTGTIDIPVPAGAVMDNPVGEVKVGNVIYDGIRQMLTTRGGAVAMAVDEARNLLYVASVNGTISVIALDTPFAAPAFSANGVVRDLSGVPQPGVTVTATAAGFSTTAVTDPTGMFVLTGLVSGAYTVKPQEAGFSFTAQTVNVSGANISGLSFIAFPPVRPASYTLSPWTLIGPGVLTTATITLNQPAPAGGQVLTLSASDTKPAKFPGTLTVAAGQASVSFAVQGNGVSVATNVTLMATSNGGTAGAALTVAPGDSLKITSATWSNSTKLLQVNGTGTNPAATLQVQDGKSNAILGTMTNLGNGSYSFQLTVASAPTSVNILSNLGGKTGQGVAIVP